MVESSLSFKIAKEAATNLRKVMQGKTGRSFGDIVKFELHT